MLSPKFCPWLLLFAGSTALSTSDLSVSLRTTKTLVGPNHYAMSGPRAIQNFKLESNAKAELLWLTGLKLAAIPRPSREGDFLCHAGLYLGDRIFDDHVRESLLSLSQEYDGHLKQVGVHNRYKGDMYLFLMSTGQNEIHLPKGFGIPVSSKQSLTSDIMLQNPRPGIEAPPVSVETMGTVYFSRETGEKEFRPLVRFRMETLVEVDANLHGDHAHAAPPGTNKHLVRAKTTNYRVGKNKMLLLHWQVPQGRHVFRSQELRFPFDSKIHLISSHVHRYAESVELFDKTTQKTVFKGKVTTTKDGHCTRRFQKGYFPSV